MNIKIFIMISILLTSTGSNSMMKSNFDGDNQDEILVTSPWGIGILKPNADTFTSPLIHPNGTRFDEWLLNTDDNQFNLIGDFNGDDQNEILVTSPWGIGILKHKGDTFSNPYIHPNGTRFGGWLLNTADNQFNLIGDFDGDGRDEILVT
ncbi:MAG: VCBS repeat-containing protein, partial [Methylococcales bacterium]